MSADEGALPLQLSMNDAMALVRHAVSLESASTHEAQTHEHTAGIRHLARRIQNEATTGAHGKYTAADVALVESLLPVLGAAGDRIAKALRSRAH
ncbi:MAG: hypothetical protein WBQ26_15055 [Gemmatimonadaceae bacterium]|nr:hypothetical protein [Gemmatimonadaceae bacterium]